MWVRTAWMAMPNAPAIQTMPTARTSHVDRFTGREKKRPSGKRRKLKPMHTMAGAQLGWSTTATLRNGIPWCMR